MRGVIKDPGELSHLLALEKCEHVADGLGGQSENWVKLRDVWARVSVQSQREIRKPNDQQRDKTELGPIVE